MLIHGTEQGQCNPATQRHVNGHADEADQINQETYQIEDENVQQDGW
jgi:hypothetical protein